MFEPYQANARAPTTFVSLPPFHDDGHFTLMRGDPAYKAGKVLQGRMDAV